MLEAGRLLAGAEVEDFDHTVEAGPGSQGLVVGGKGKGADVVVARGENMSLLQSSLLLLLDHVPQRQFVWKSILSPLPTAASQLVFPTKSGHEVKDYSDCSYSTGDTYPK